MSPGWVNSQTQQTTLTPWSSVWNLIECRIWTQSKHGLGHPASVRRCSFRFEQDAGDQHFSDSFVVEPFIQLDLAKDRRVFGELCIV
jgi:hypothetical protein